MRRNKPSMLVLKLLLILNGKIKRLRLFTLKSLNLKKKLQKKVARKTKIKIKIKKKNKKSSAFLTMSKTNLSHWKSWLLLQLKKLTKKSQNWEKEKSCSREDVNKNKFQKLILNCWTKLRTKNLQEDKLRRRNLKLRKNSQPFDLNYQ